MGQPGTSGAKGGQLSVTYTDGTPYVPVGALSFASSNPAVATVDPASGLVTAVAAGQTTLSGADAGNSESDTVLLTVSIAESGFVLVFTPAS